MTSQNDDTNDGGNVVPFPKVGAGISGVKADRDDRPLPAAKAATLAEEARNAEIYEHLNAAMGSAKLGQADQIALAINMRDLVYGLEDRGILDIKDLAPEVRGPSTPREVRSIAEYVAPRDVVDAADYLARYEKRRLAKKSAAYLRMAVAAAKLSNTDVREAVLQLARGTRFWPEQLSASDDELRSARQVMAVLDDVVAALDRTYPLARYFESLERLQLVPIDRGDEVVCVQEWDEEENPAEHLIYPAVRIAVSFVADHAATLIVGKIGDRDWATGAAELDTFSVTVREQRVFSVAVATIGGRNRIAGLFTKELALPNGRYGSVIKQWRSDRLGPGWRIVRIKSKAGEDEALWRLDDYGLSDLEMDGFDWEEDRPSEGKLVAVDVDFLLRDHGRWFGDFKGTGVFSSVERLTDGPSRIGSIRSLPRLIERALVVEQQGGGPIQALAVRYTKHVEAMEKKRKIRFDYVEGELERLRERLSDAHVDLTAGPSQENLTR